MTEEPLMSYPCEQTPTGVAATTAAVFADLVPVINTSRLTLTAPDVSDFTIYADIVCTERGRYVGGPMTREDAWYDFIQLASSWMLHGHGGWRIRTSGSNTTIGFVILGFEPGDQEIELGYLLAEPFEGKGYATEATLAVRDHAFARYEWNSLVSYIHIDNDRSVKVAERLGARRDTDAEMNIDGGGSEFVVYRHLSRTSAI